ncbi:DUF5050 domain-containing protein [Sporosarcina sp. FSL K6-5500]|uniref:DUF5050 domain-containing protein n=1 Tax=Sporosarcina sp. FSL K6-5500 TaxID=2921558 RepID=UPI0030FA5C3E
MKITIKLLTVIMALLLWMPASFLANTDNEPILASDNWTNDAVIAPSVDVPTHRAAALIENNRTVSSLSDLKAAVYSGFKNYEQTFSIDYIGDTANLKADLQSILDEILVEDEYLHGTLASWSWTYKGYVNDVTINFSNSYLTNKQQEQFVDSEIARILGEITEPSMNEFQKVKAVNDFIVLNTAYSFDTAASPHSVYAILNEQQGVCQAYALLAYKMLNNLGFDVHYVTGEAGGIGHAWNLVKVDGKWYNLDTTWNDPTPNRKAQVYYNYFLVTDNQLKKDHSWTQGDFPVATSTEYSFMHSVTSAYTLNDVVYYSDETDGNKLYKMDLLTQEKTKLTDSMAQYITAFGGKVYFSNYSNGAHLTEIGTDGTNVKELNKMSSTNLYIEQPYLYFTSKDGSLEKVKISSAITFDTAKYTMWDEKETKDLKKEWRIEMNAPVNNTTVNDQTVYIVDAEGNHLSFINPVVENQQFIRLQNNSSFSPGNRYYVVIENSIRSNKEKVLTKGVVMPFVVK